jgi:cation diffusion facilitator CzcD-associated flavoprotein CzcO
VGRVKIKNKRGSETSEIQRGEERNQSEIKDKFMAEGNFVQPAIPRFDGHYDHWAMLMENLLRSKDY